MQIKIIFPKQHFQKNRGRFYDKNTQMFGNKLHTVAVHLRVLATSSLRSGGQNVGITTNKSLFYLEGL